MAEAWAITGVGSVPQLTYEHPMEAGCGTNQSSGYRENIPGQLSRLAGSNVQVIAPDLKNNPIRVQGSQPGNGMPGKVQASGFSHE